MELQSQTQLSDWTELNWIKKLMPSNCSVREDPWEFLGLQGGQTSQWIFIGRTDAEAETPILWPPDAKNWCKDADAGKDWRQEWEKGTTEDKMVRMASPTQWTWVWANSGSRWWTGKPGMLQSMGFQRVRDDWTIELNWTELSESFGLPRWLNGKNPPAKHEMWVWSLSQEDPWSRKWQPTPVFLPGKFHGQRNLAGYSQWGRKELDMT